MTWQLFRALDAEWEVLVKSAAARAATARWAGDAVLGPQPDLTGIVAVLRAGGSDPAGADRLLGALAARAPADDVALRVMLQALLPGLANVAKRLGRGVVDETLEADVIVEGVERIRHYPLGRRPRAIAANVVLDVFGRIARRRADDDWPVIALYDAPPVVELDPSVEVLELIIEAREGGWLRPADAELLLSVAVGRDTLGRRAEREHTTYAAVHERWRRARERLRRSVHESTTDLDGGPPTRSAGRSPDRGDASASVVWPNR
jgi:hypothetical protein